MIRLFFYLRIAVKNLFRGGQRMLVAWFCVIFGVMTLVAMTLLSQSIEKMLVLEPHELIGADLTLDREAEDFITVQNEEKLEELKKSQVIDQFSLMAYTTSLTFRLPETDELAFPSVGMGVNPELYPLAGKLTLGEPEGILLPDLLKGAGDVVITYDLALEYDLTVGDVIILSDLRRGKSIEGVVRGIAVDTPNHQGSKVYYSLATADLLLDGQRSVNTALANSTHPDAAMEALAQLGWRVFTAEKLASMEYVTQEGFEFGLNGAGLLGLLIGGMGIANTMQVLMRRRRREVAIWKTLGYRAGQLQTMFALEAFLLGLSGSLVGASLGSVLSYGLVDLFSRTTTLLIHWVFSWQHVLMGTLVGVVSTLIYAMWAIVVTSKVSPLAILRNEVLQGKMLSVFQLAALALCLAISFMFMAGMVMGSFWKGIGVILAAVLFLVVIGGILGAFAWLVTKVLPLGLWRFGGLVRKNMRKSAPALIFAMTALFTGVISLTAGVVTTTSAKKVMEIQTQYGSQYNLAVYAAGNEVDEVLAALNGQGMEQLDVELRAAVLSVHWQENTDTVISPLLVGRTDPGEYTIAGADWGSHPEGVYVYQYLGIPQGSKLDVVLNDGQVREMEVVGTYSSDGINTYPGVQLGILMPSETLLSYTSADTVRVFSQAEAKTLKPMITELSNALPQVTVINLPSFNLRYIADFQNLFIFVAAMSGLSILAGILLMANSVSIAMLDRRYEMGVMKVMGFSHGQILSMLVVEYTLIAVIVSMTALGIVEGLLALFGFTLNQGSGGAIASIPPLAGLLSLSLPVASGIALFAIALSILTVILVTWKPTQVSPVVVLNDCE